MRDHIQQRFSRYLMNERGLTSGTVDVYVRIIRQFVKARFGKKPIRFNRLTHQDIIRFIVRQAHTVHASYAQTMVYALRAFVRFLHVRGTITAVMSAFVPTVATWRLSRLPQPLTAQQVERVLKMGDQHTVIGQRNHTMLLMLARLGLRAGEVVNLQLDDIHWDTGELIIRGKGNREDKLPILQDVGKALARYIRYGRPACAMRHVFIHAKKPYRGFARSSALYPIVKQALQCAGIHSTHAGPHILRHSLASRMLHKGISLPVISKILRHRSLNTTQLYTKVDLPGLRMLAQRWPGGAL